MVAVGPATTVLRSSTRTPVSGGGKKLKIAQRYMEAGRGAAIREWLKIVTTNEASFPSRDR